MRSFNREIFFPIKKKINIDNLKNIIGDNFLSSKIDNNFVVTEISSPSLIRENSLLFLENELNLKNINTKNLHIISSSKENFIHYKDISIVKNLSIAYNKICNNLFFHDD